MGQSFSKHICITKSCVRAVSLMKVFCLRACVSFFLSGPRNNPWMLKHGLGLVERWKGGGDGGIVAANLLHQNNSSIWPTPWLGCKCLQGRLSKLHSTPSLVSSRRDVIKGRAEVSFTWVFLWDGKARATVFLLLKNNENGVLVLKKPNKKPKEDRGNFTTKGVSQAEKTTTLPKA